MHEGSLFGYITFSQNYSVNLANRFMWGRFAADDDSLEKSKLIITLDKSRQCILIKTIKIYNYDS